MVNAEIKKILFSVTCSPLRLLCMAHFVWVFLIIVDQFCMDFHPFLKTVCIYICFEHFYI